MKRYLIPLLFMFFIFAIPQKAEAQFLKNFQKRVENKVEREVDRRAERRADKAINDNLDKMEDAIDGKGKDSNQKEDNSGQSNNGNSSNGQNNSPTENNEQDDASEETYSPNVVWSKFDFVPGDTVIFEDMPSADEENGEFPSRWDLHKGSAEVGEMDGKNVIMFLDGGGSIVPYLKNPKEDHLPEVFTVEMDVWFEKGNDFHRYWISLKDSKNQYYTGPNDRFQVYANGIEFGSTDKRYPGTEANNWAEEPIGQWRHIAIAFTRGKMKAYMDDTRLINVPHFEENPTGITIQAENDQMYIKNIRIAKGGVKYYDRVLSEGRIIVNGIKFDINKATLKAESMGPINRIYKLMVENTDLNFSVEGHTDADGGDEANMKLSKARGKAVMDKLISMGIDSSRLKSNGFGESKPLDNNSTPEGKANNRRVEFVKF